MELNQYCERKSVNLDDKYICAGNRTYIVGSQDGSFPDFGHHVADEMGGVWDHPIKLLDGFWLNIKREDAGEHGIWLEQAHTFENHPFYNVHLYDVEPHALAVERRQFCPDDVEGVIVTYTVTNRSESQAQTLLLSVLARTDLSPVWFSEPKHIEDGDDSGRIDEDLQAFVARDLNNPWFVAVGASIPLATGVVDKELFGPERTAGRGVSGLLCFDRITVAAGGSVDVSVFIAGSYRSEEQAKHTLHQLRTNHEEYWSAKQARYHGILGRSQVSMPDKQLEKVFDWVRFNTDWLIREVPEVGRALGAGHPEYPWWFGCDNSYSVKGLLPLGEFQLAQDTLHLLAQASLQTNGNGRIIHEISTSGAVYNPGNTQETPHFIACVWETFLWTGDLMFVKSMYPLLKQGIAWLLNDMDPDGDLLPEGYGIIEIEGLNLELIDTAVYTCEALRVAALMAHLFGDTADASRYSQLSQQLRDTINGDLWLDDEGLYADAMGEPGPVLGRLDQYIDRARQAGEESAATELEAMQTAWSASEGSGVQRPWLFKNWVINTPMEMGIAPKDKAIRALNRMATDEFTGPWGVYLSGLYRTHMMTISTGVQAVAECRYDRMDEALRMVKLIASTFGQRLPGSISEMSPDYGCFVQAWTLYGIAWPIVVHMVGIQPRAYWKQVTIRPRLPKAWNTLAVKRVAVGTGLKVNTLDVSIDQSATEAVYQVTVDQAGWTVVLDVVAADDDTVSVDGKLVAADCHDGAVTVTLSRSGTHVVRVTKSVK